MAKILVVEDEDELRENIVETMELDRHNVESVADGLDAQHLLKVAKFDLVILDWNLPGMSGLEICTDLRSRRDTTPVIMLTAKKEVADKESGLDAGADDYLTKPFHVRELTARVRSVLRRAAGNASTVLEGQDILMDTRLGKVMRSGRVVKLTAQEFSVLEFLLRHKDQFFTAEALLERVWDSESETTTESVRQCIRRLRSKLDSEGEDSFLCTVPGLGYKIET